ncbi:hypothetical protein CYY_003451 [Polysphondylium violaceum]|uniref:peptidylprolyl isomerase n=1 Tax=Polysphondylium violaceum TaxID=133409 RepID=A0A8J4PWC9_9MYCE|nr:hypothetical protein CYY_003451 [Polysphondylium violaceum]
MKISIISLVIFALLASVVISQKVELLSSSMQNEKCPTPLVKLHDNVSVSYVGKYEDGTVFDSSEFHGPFSFVVGGRQVIPGFEIGVMGACLNEKRTIKIPYQLAYGEQGIEGKIPPKADLFFDLEIVDVVAGPDVPLYVSLIPSGSTIGAFVILGIFVGAVYYIVKLYPGNADEKPKPHVKQPKEKKNKKAKSN